MDFFHFIVESDYLRDLGDVGIENEEERGKATTPAPVPKRPVGVLVPFDNRYTLHADRTASKNLLEATSKLKKEAREVVNDWLRKYGPHDVHFTKENAGTLQKNPLVRLDFQHIDGKEGERRYANLQIQLNKERESAKETTTLAILHVELDQNFDHPSIQSAFDYGLTNHVGVWLSAKPNHG